MHVSDPADLSAAVRRAAVLAAPAAVVALVLFFAALAVTGDDIGALARSPLGVVSNVLALISTGLLLLGLVHLATTHDRLTDRTGRGAVLAAGAGTLLLAGGAWAQLVIVPALATEAPRLANEGHTLVTTGYVASFLAAGIGWLLVALRLRRDERLGRGPVRLLLIGSVLMLAPLPTRWFVLAIAVSLLARARTPRVAPRSPVPANG